MDIVSHALWTNAIYQIAKKVSKKKTERRDTWLAMFFGIAPDLFSFGIYSTVMVLTSGTLLPYAQARFRSEWLEGTGFLLSLISGGNHPAPDPAALPQYLHDLYNITHSFAIFAIIFGIVWMVRKRPYWLFSAWGLHILFDVYSHSDKYFPTPILFPFSDFKTAGVSWADPTFFIINYALLAIVYVFLYKYRRTESKTSSA